MNDEEGKMDGCSNDEDEEKNDEGNKIVSILDVVDDGEEMNDKKMNHIVRQIKVLVCHN